MLYSFFNLIEGVWWLGLGMWTFLHYRKTLSQKQSTVCFEPSGPRIKSGVTIYCSICMAVILILFGISDFVEMTTGAWWRPWWLLVWKALCLGVGLILIIRIYMNRRP